MKAKSGDDTAHYHAWRSDQTDDEVTALHKVGPAFQARKAARVWLRSRPVKLARVLICRDEHCPALDLGDDMPSPEGDGTSKPDPSPESSRSPNPSPESSRWPDPSPAPSPAPAPPPEPSPPRTPQPGGSPF